MSERLAIHGGRPVIDRSLAVYDPIDQDDVKRANEVLKSRALSGFMGAPGDQFMGGPWVRTVEQQISEAARTGFAVTTNSWTSGLLASLLAVGVSQGDEVITTPWTMCATSAAIRQAGARPRYVDISPEDFNMDLAQVPDAITSQTSAVLAVDIFGRPTDRSKLAELGDRFGIPIVVDAAQAPLLDMDSQVDNSGIAIWGYSFNYHKHAHCGEGGVALTADAKLAERLSLFRNHGEILGGIDSDRLVPGFNFRLGEMECALLTGQINRLPDLVRTRQQAAERIAQGLEGLPGLIVPRVAVGDSHAYYILGMSLVDRIAPKRQEIANALRAEGVPGVLEGYQNIHRLPAYWTGTSLPIAERLHEATFLGLYLCGWNYDEVDCELVVSAFQRVWAAMRLERVD